jgi:hypothetical protein
VAIVEEDEETSSLPEEEEEEADEGEGPMGRSVVAVVVEEAEPDECLDTMWSSWSRAREKSETW